MGVRSEQERCSRYSGKQFGLGYLTPACNRLDLGKTVDWHGENVYTYYICKNSADNVQIQADAALMLLEMLVVLAIMVSLCTVALSSLRSYRDKALLMNCKSNLKELALAEEAFRCERLRYLPVADWARDGAALVRYLRPGGRGTKCPKSGLGYIISPFDDIRYGYRAYCLTKGHEWQAVTGAGLCLKR